MTISDENEIRLRAYEMWHVAGMNEGDAEHHWLHAEAVVRNKIETSTSGTPQVNSETSKSKRLQSRTVAKVAEAKPAKAETVKAKALVAKSTKTETAELGAAGIKSAATTNHIGALARRRTKTAAPQASA